MILRELRPSLTLFVIFMAVTGFGYPMLTLTLGENFFPHQASGSLIEVHDKVIGSSLIGQSFTSDIYFHSRPSAAGSGYDASNSGASNLAPTSPDLLKAVGDRVAEFKKAGASGLVPVDLVTASASGLDPDISPAAAYFQAARVAAARNINVTQIEKLITDHTQVPSFGFIGASRVNVLELNMALDQLAPSAPPAASP